MEQKRPLKRDIALQARSTKFGYRVALKINGRKFEGESREGCTPEEIFRQIVNKIENVYGHSAVQLAKNAEIKKALDETWSVVKSMHEIWKGQADEEN